MTITGARPAQHWDATFTETLNSGVATKNWTLHLGHSFADVPSTVPYYRFVENLFHNAITGGCGPNAFCPTSPVTRGQMAVFLLRSEHGIEYLPPACSSTLFTDVPCPGGVRSSTGSTNSSARTSRPAAAAATTARRLRSRGRRWRSSCSRPSTARATRRRRAR